MEPNNTLKFEKVKNHNRLSEVIAGQIRKAIFEKQLSLGDRLPSEKQLTTIFGASRTTVREALRLLEISGLIIVKPGQEGGSFISQPDITRLQSMVLDLIKTKNLKMEHFTQARMILEPNVIEIIANSLTEEEMELLEQNVKNAEDALEEKDPQILYNNMMFHQILVECTKNPIIIMIFNLLAHSITAYSKMARPTKEVGHRIVLAHRQILEGLKEGKVKLVQKLMIDHLIDIGRRIKADMSSRDIEYPFAIGSLASSRKNVKNVTTIHSHTTPQSAAGNQKGVRQR